MSNRIFISTEHFKTMLNQWKDKTDRLMLYQFNPKDSTDTIVLVSELRSNGFLLYWANKNTITQGNAEDEAQKIARELADKPLPF